MSRLSRIFQARERCFIPFVTAGHPGLNATREIILRLVEAGSDIVEIGLPFSDPIADGPVIQQSSFSALRHGYGMEDYFELVHQLRKRTSAGLIFMTYLNPVMRFGLKKLEGAAIEAGLDGVLISDLPPEEHLHLGAFERLETIFMAAPTSSNQRLEKIAAVCQGFVYLVARTGVTGAQTDLRARMPATLRRIRRWSSLPIAVGFGIRSAHDVEQVWQYAEGAVVGSAIVDFIEQHGSDPKLPQLVGGWVKQSLIPNRRLV